MGLLDALGGQQPQGGAMPPLMMALLGLLAYRTMKGQGSPPGSVGTSQDPNEESPALPGILGGLGGLLSGTPQGGALSAGLQDILNCFRQSGHGDKAESWIATGPNKPIAPQQVGEALGEDRVRWLMQQTGMSQDQLVSGLSAKLPELMDKLTPNGRLPTEQEAAQLIH
jgi:uncharacterized protein YidB (DUF937 family)